MKYPKCPKCGGHRLLAPAHCFVEVAIQDDGRISTCKLDEPLDVTLDLVPVLKCARCGARLAPGEVV